MGKSACGGGSLGLTMSKKWAQVLMVFSICGVKVNNLEEKRKFSPFCSYCKVFLLSENAPVIIIDPKQKTV